MRALNIAMAAIMILFAVVQYNDPDGLFWSAVYGVGALWCVVAAFRAATFASGPGVAAFLATCVGALYGLIHFWPTTPRWWMQDVWWETETAREGMGMMILLVALALAGALGLRRRRA